MAGGTGSGKSTFAAKLWETNCIVFDSTFSDVMGHGALVEQALHAGRKVQIIYVYRDPLAAYRATLKRSAEEGWGRSITPWTHASTHEGAARTVKCLSEQYAGNPNVAFRFVDNENARPGKGSVVLTSRGDYYNLRERIQSLDTALRNRARAV